MNLFRDRQLAFRANTSGAPTSALTRHTVLISSTCWWPSAARLALRFASLGWHVEALCPSQHPLHKTRSVRRFHRYKALRPLQALSAAVRISRPDLVVPCDDRALGHLLTAQAAAPHSLVGELADACFGSVESHSVLRRRGELIQLAREGGLRAPVMREVSCAEDIQEAAAEFGLPFVLKVDGSWGGMGVVIAYNLAEAEFARIALQRRSSLGFAIKSLLLRRDPYQLLPSFSGTLPQVYAQRFVQGRAANVATVCWGGECLASIQMEALLTRNALGSAAVVRMIDHPEITRASEYLIRQLKISGFCGFDFVIEDSTGHAHLVEMNARATPTSHLASGGRDLVTALAARLQGASPIMPGSPSEGSITALFPDAWQCAPRSIYLSSGHHDVPWEEPELVRELTKMPYPDRGVIAQLSRLWRTGRSKAKGPDACLSPPEETDSGSVWSG